MSANACRQARVEFHLEAGHCLYFYYEAEKAAEHFATAQQLTGLTVQLTGKHFATAQQLTGLTVQLTG